MSLELPKLGQVFLSTYNRELYRITYINRTLSGNPYYQLETEITHETHVIIGLKELQENYIPINDELGRILYG